MGRLAAHGNKGVESGLNLKIEVVGKTLRVFPTKGLQSAARIIFCLPLPVGEVSERSEDGEGK